MPDEAVVRAKWYPDMPPKLDGETDYQYTDRLTGADKTDRVPYDHSRRRQCSIGWHGECSDFDGADCKCPHHTEGLDVWLKWMRWNQPD